MSDLEEAFTGLVDALATGDLGGFYGRIDPRAVILDEDLPFRVDRGGFEAHIAFHGPGNWEGFQWKPSHARFLTAGLAGVVTGFAMFRGKPVDSGYRLRPMLFTQTWHREDGDWKVTSWHQSPIVGHVSTQSPG